MSELENKRLIERKYLSQEIKNRGIRFKSNG